MKIFRCIICGEVTFATDAPSNCPFCSAGRTYLRDISRVNGEDIFDTATLSEEVRKYLLVLLNELSKASSYFKCVSNASKSEDYRAVFKRLAKISREHADVIRKILELDPIVLSEEECSIDDNENFEKTLMYLAAIKDLYNQAAGETKEETTKTMFRAYNSVYEQLIEMVRDLEG